MPLPPTYQPLRFEHLAGRKVAIYDGHQKGFESTAASSLEIARHLATGMDDKGVDDAFVLFNLDAVVERFLQWRTMLPRVHPFYAVKCNNDPVLLKLLADLGCGFDCASRGEIDQIVEAGLAGCSGEHVIYANPCKTRSYIRHADQMGIRRMTFDSVGELTKILECHSSPELLIRIAVADPTAQCPLAIKFGCDPLEEAPKLIKAATEMGLQLVGVSFHVGSGCRDPRAFGLAILAARKLFDLGLSLGHPMSLLDIGGGFPGQDNEQITFGEIVDIVLRALDEHFPADSDLPVEVIAEPGRFFGASPVSLCANVIATTEVSATRVTKRAEDAEMEGQMLYVNDGVYGSFNCILFDHSQPRGRPLFEMAAEKGDEEEKTMIPTIVWGQTCDGLDQIEAQTAMRRLRVGDWLYYDRMGAYTSVAASHFNGFDNPRAYYAISDRCWNAVYGAENDVIVDENFLVPEAEERRQDE